MMEQARKLLHDTYGYDAFRGPQQQVIEAALDGSDTLVLMPTGGGKSLCYQIPALVRDGLGIVVSPLIALMQDQVSALQQLGIQAAFLNSTQNPVEQQQVVEQMHRGELDILYIAPERLLQPRTLSLLGQLPVSLIAIDEAHCVSQWGHDFRQDYLSLHILEQHFPGVPRMALTATADPRTQEEIPQRLHLNEHKRFVSGFDRSNIRYAVQPKSDAKKQLLRFLIGHKNNAGIVYCMSRKKVESTAEWLCGRGLNALPYHAGLPADTRAEHLQRFLREDAVVMVATIAFGMGIDKPDVRFVAHLDLPKSMEAYYQETGRAGRDGEPADAWMVYGLRDVVRLVQMMDSSSAADQQKRIERSKLDSLLGWCEVTECRRRALLAYFGEQYCGPEGDGRCGNCDVCLSPPQTWEGTEAAQKLLSTVYRSGQRFGAGHVIDILRGKQNDKISQWDHQQLSTFGIGADLTDSQWRSIIRQLVVHGFLVADPERYGALRLTEASRPLLRGEITLTLRQDVAEKALRRPARKPTSSAVSDGDRQLWEALRARRKQLADEQGVPPYVVFHDATLMEMMEYQPTSEAELLNISGVGQSKLDKFGSEFLQVLREHTAC
ncbi:MAG: DNA helicase RecQ [Porticoccaceae bacterium]|nr:DNA helicase RecQ [Porticoccaceae bacterium]